MLKRRNKLIQKSVEEDDPMSVVSNLFDVAMVFAVALMVALVTHYNMTEMFSQEDFTMVKNPCKPSWKPSRRKDKKSTATPRVKTSLIRTEQRENEWGLLMNLRTEKSFMYLNNKIFLSFLFSFFNLFYYLCKSFELFRH